MELCKQHIEECESLEKRKQFDSHTADRVELLGSNGNTNGNYYSATSPRADDPFTHSDLPDIDVEEDFKAIKNRNKEIDQDMDDLGAGVSKLKELALDMGTELDKQNEAMDRIDIKVESALDHVDNINIVLKKSLDGVCLIDIDYEGRQVHGQLYFTMCDTCAGGIHLDPVHFLSTY